MSADSLPISGQLPPELDEEVWLNLDYEDTRTLCQTARGSSNEIFNVSRAICDNEAPWVTRAQRYLKIQPTDFWNREPWEQSMELVGRTEGQRAQMRYVELVSRRGVVSDSSYFLSDQEMFRRALFEKRDDLIDKYLPKADLVPTLSEFLIKLPEGTNNNIHNHLHRLIRQKDPNNAVLRVMLKGFFGIDDREFLRGQKSSLTAKYMYWMVLGQYRKNLGAKLELMNQFVTEMVPAWQNEFHHFSVEDIFLYIIRPSVLEALIIRGQTQYLSQYDDLVAELYPNQLDGANEEFYWNLARVPNSQALSRTIMWLVPLVGPFELELFASIFGIMLREGRFDLAEGLERGLGPKNFSAMLDKDFLFQHTRPDVLVQSSYAASALIYLKRKGMELTLADFKAMEETDYFCGWGTKEEYQLKTFYYWVTSDPMVL